MPHDHDHHHDHVHLDETHWSAWADHAALEGEVLLPFVTEAMARVRDLRDADAPPVRCVLDIGSGPGVGTCELARAFPEAEVIAVDSSPAMLERVDHRAAALGLGDRVRTHLAELPGGLDGLGPAQVIWASLSLHHVGDEVAALRALREALAPGGLLAIAELADPVRVLPDDLDVGPPGLGDRIDRAGATWFASMRESLPGAVPSTDLPSMVRAAGLDVVVAETPTLRHDPPLAADARRFAVDQLRRVQGRLADHLDQDDLAAVAVLADADDPRSLAHRSDALVAASRQLIIAARSK